MRSAVSHDDLAAFIVPCEIYADKTTAFRFARVRAYVCFYVDRPSLVHVVSQAHEPRVFPGLHSLASGILENRLFLKLAGWVHARRHAENRPQHGAQVEQRRPHHVNRRRARFQRLPPAIGKIDGIGEHGNGELRRR